MRTKHEILEELKQIEEQEKFMESAPLPQETKGQDVKKSRLEYKILTRRLIDIEEQLAKKGRIEETSEFRPNRVATLNEMLNKRDIVLFEINAVKSLLLALGTNIDELEKEI